MKYETQVIYEIVSISAVLILAIVSPIDLLTKERQEVFQKTQRLLDHTYDKDQESR